MVRSARAFISTIASITSHVRPPCPEVTRSVDRPAGSFPVCRTSSPIPQTVRRPPYRQLQQPRVRRQQ